MWTLSDLLKNFFTHKDFLPSADQIPGTMFTPLHFIFSAICEEMGVLGGVAILMLYFLLVYRGFKIALSSTNEFNNTQ